MKSKKLLSLLLSGTFVLSGTISVFAEEDLRPVPIDGSTLNLSRSERSYEPGIGGAEARQEDIDYWNNVEKEEPSSYPKIGGRAVSWVFLNPFTYFSQETTYSCGAAAARMALGYLKPSSPYSEATVRNGCKTSSAIGTYLSDMALYVNAQQSRNTYIGRYKFPKTTMKDNLYRGIAVYDAPPVVGLCETTNNGWPFNLEAHFVAIYSAKSDQSEFALCDPWGGYIGQTSWLWYDKSDDDLYDAYNAVNLGYMF